MPAGSRPWPPKRPSAANSSRPKKAASSTPRSPTPVPLWDGKRGFMHHTSATVGKLGPGELRLDMQGGGSKSWFVEGGFMQNVDDVLTILASGAVPADELSAEEAKAELAEATARTPENAADMDKITEDRTPPRQTRHGHTPVSKVSSASCQKEPVSSTELRP
ncbi:MAG: hypothetical protein R3B46_05160 [Phycisphaerales bacterium]